MKTEANFFCETCHKKVPPDAEECPHCGRIFSSTKCPMCHFESNAYTFLEGCPQCGYMSPKIASGKRMKEDEKQEKAFKLIPSWVYLVSSIVLAALLFFLIIMIIFRAS